MNNSKILFPILIKHKHCIPYSFRNFHSAQVLSEREVPNSYGNYNVDTSLFYTNLPNKRRERKVKQVFHLNPGKLVIQCKNKKLNHYSGMHYGNLDVIPLASKGWAHRMSKGDYFTILPTKKYSPFPAEGDLPKTFEECKVSEQVCNQLRKIKVVQPTVIQAKALEKLLSGENVLMLGECGSGKTLAYVIAMVENLQKWKDKVPSRVNSPLGIAVVSSRELALQVMQLTSSICHDLGLQCRALVDGHSRELLENPTAEEVDILICTASAIAKHLRRKIYSAKFCKHVVVDDADAFEVEEKFEFLKMFFGASRLNYSGLNSPNFTPNSAQICFVSAVSPSSLQGKLNELIMMNEITTVSTSYLHRLLYNVPQEFLRLSNAMVAHELLKAVKSNIKNQKPTLIFSNRNKTCNWVSFFLKDNNIECLTINKKDSPTQRLENFRDFESGIVPALSATNLLSLGFHFPHVRHVVNVEFPRYMTDYIHRCGRVGRLGQVEDCLITNFIVGKEYVPLVQKIEKAVRTNSELPGIYYPKTYYKPGIDVSN